MLQEIKKVLVKLSLRTGRKLEPLKPQAISSPIAMASPILRFPKVFPLFLEISFYARKHRARNLYGLVPRSVFPRISEDD